MLDIHINIRLKSKNASDWTLTSVMLKKLQLIWTEGNISFHMYIYHYNLGVE